MSTRVYCDSRGSPAHTVQVHQSCLLASLRMHPTVSQSTSHPHPRDLRKSYLYPIPIGVASSSLGGQGEIALGTDKGMLLLILCTMVLSMCECLVPVSPPLPFLYYSVHPPLLPARTWQDFGMADEQATERLDQLWRVITIGRRTASAFAAQVPW